MFEGVEDFQNVIGNSPLFYSCSQYDMNLYTFVILFHSKNVSNHVFNSYDSCGKLSINK